MSTIVRLGRAALAASAVAAMVACGNNNPNSTAANKNPNPNATPTPAATNDQAKANENAQPITINGCLQQGKYGTWIVTRLNEPSKKEVGTSGSAAAVEHEQLREAENAYRVDAPSDVKMDQFLGKQVRVTGKLTDRGDVAKSANDTAATSGSASANDKKADKGLDISQRDLARIDASSVTATGPACGNGKASSHKAAPHSKKK
jgi:hypothetical protein